MKKVLKIISRVLTVLLIVFTFAIMSLAIYNFVSIKILHKDYPNLFGHTFFEIVIVKLSFIRFEFLLDLGSEFLEDPILSL